MPSLTILADPNGAGKNRSTDLLLDVDLILSLIDQNQIFGGKFNMGNIVKAVSIIQAIIFEPI